MKCGRLCREFIAKPTNYIDHGGLKLVIRNMGNRIFLFGQKEMKWADKEHSVFSVT